MKKRYTIHFDMKELKALQQSIEIIKTLKEYIETAPENELFYITETFTEKLEITENILMVLWNEEKVAL